MAGVNKFCPNCGRPIGRDMKFCGYCGSKLEQVGGLPRIPRKIRIPAAVLLVILMIVCFTGSGDVDFRDVAERLGESRFLRVEEEGRAMIIDTNPDDLRDVDYLEAWSLILRALEELDLPVEDIKPLLNATAPGSGIHTREYGDVVLSWQYHPDIGLEVLFENE